jgi:hypothetical protein
MQKSYACSNFPATFFQNKFTEKLPAAEAPVYADFRGLPEIRCFTGKNAGFNETKSPDFLQARNFF